MDITQLDMRWLLTLAASPLTLGFIVFGAVAMLKRDYEKTPTARPLNPWAWRGFAALIGLILSLLLHLVTDRATLGYPGWLGALLFGLAAAACAVLGRDGLKTALSWLSGAGAGAAVAVQDANTVNVNVPPAPAPMPDPVIPAPAPEPIPTPAPPAPEPVAAPLMLYPPNTPGMENVLHRGLILGSLPTPSSTITPEVSP